MASKINAARMGETTRHFGSARQRRAVMTEQELQAYLLARDALRRIRHTSWLGATQPQARNVGPG